MTLNRSPFFGRRVLVLGASGFIGYWVARALRTQGAFVACAVRSADGAERLAREHLGNAVVRRDLEDLDALARWLPALAPAIVFNLAGYGVDRSEREEARARRLNVELVEALARAMATLPRGGWTGRRLVHAGSALEYGTTGGLLDEESPCAPTTLYGSTKLAGTRALQAVAAETGLEACVARLFTVYGPGEHAGRLLPSLLQAARSGEALPLTSGLQHRDFTYVEDVAEGLLRLAISEGPAGEVVNLATGVMRPVRDFADAAASVLGVAPASLRWGELPTRPEEMAHDGVSVTRLRLRTRWAPSDDVSHGIARTVARLAEPVAWPVA